MTAKSYPVQRHVPVTFNMEVPPPPPGCRAWPAEKVDREIEVSKYSPHDDTLLKSDVTSRDHVSVVMDAGSRIVNFIVSFIRDGTVFA